MSTITVPNPKQSSQLENFEHVYSTYAPLVYRAAWGVLANREDAQDALQTTFLRLLRSGLPLDFQRNPNGYLYRAAVNAALDILKRRRRHPEQTLDLGQGVEMPVDQSRLRFDDETCERLHSAIARLNPNTAEVVMLHYMQRKSTTQIAQELGTSRSAIVLRLFRARAALRKLL
jgi:RNA polymerase sigma-70 factor (ECF subfamily)